MKCPYCYKEVQPTSNGTCPACHAEIVKPEPEKAVRNIKSRKENK